MAKSGLSRHVPLSPQAVCPIVLLFVAPRPRAASPEGRRPTAKCRGICFYKESSFSLSQPETTETRYAGHGNESESTHVPLAHSTRATAAALALPPFHLSTFHLSTSTPQVPRTPLSPLQAPLRGNFAVGRRPSGPAAARCRSPLLGLVSSVFVRLVLRLTPLRNCAGFCYTSFRLEKRPL